MNSPTKNKTYDTAAYQQARIIIFLQHYAKKHGIYPRRWEIAEELGVSLSYVLKLTAVMIKNGIIKTSSWNREKKQWTTIIGLNRNAVRAAKKVISWRDAQILWEQTGKLPRSMSAI